MEPTRIFDLLDRLLEKYPDKNDIFAKSLKGCWRKISVKEYRKNSYYLAAAFLNLVLTQNDKVIIVSNNRPEWNFIDMALGLARIIPVPVYTTLSDDDFSYIIRHSEAKVICVGNDIILAHLLPVLKKLPVKPIVIMMDNHDVGKEGELMQFINLSTLIEEGKATYSQHLPKIEENKKEIKPDDLFTIIYTSGTTGTPKGVMLSHHNLLFNAIGHAVKQIKDHKSKMLSFLPLCHIYERSMNYEYQYLGISTYYAESLSTIAADLASCHADGFCGVPRVLEQMFVKLESTGKNLKGIKKEIYQWAFKFGTKFNNYNTNPLYLMKWRIADKLVYSKWRAVLGGKEMLVVSGGSAINEKVIRLFNAAKLHIFEGYGMTETSPVIAVNNPIEGINIIGTVGKPMEGTEMKIAEDGEILTRGPHIMLGYYKDQDYTSEVIDKEGWFHTGDIGTMIEGKYLKLTDRKKEIFKLSLGKYVAPQVIENMLKGSSYIENCIVIGANQKFASALIVPNISKLHYWAAKRKIDYNSNEELLNNAEVIDKIHREVKQINERLAPHEQIKKERIVTEEWNTSNNMLSQTLKLKRNIIKNHYKSLIVDIYSSDKQHIA